MALAPQPVSVTLATRDATAQITWDDGHSSTYPAWYLRGWCPCAACQGHGGGWSFVAGGAARLVDICEVGNYALNLVWEEPRHDTGIYTFELLRTLCPCAPCRDRVGAAHPWHRAAQRM